MNWGTGITISIVAFMIFILSMVYKANMVKSDLFADNYYEQEIGYQRNIHALKNANGLKNKVDIQVHDKKVVVHFPIENKAEYTGLIHFYRPNNSKLDKIVDIKMDTNNVQTISTNQFVAGKYEVFITWIDKGEEYRVEKQVYIK